MSANNLLLWMSAKRRGSWQQFRAAVEELHLDWGDTDIEENEDEYERFVLPLYQALRFNLQRVGHAEFFSGAGDEADWRVTPPTMAVMRRANDWLAIVVGARSPGLLQRLRAAVAPAIIKAMSFPAYPDQLLITAGTLSTLETVAKGTGLILQCDAPAALLSSIPAIDDPRVRNSSPMPFGVDWRIDRFSCEDLGWRSATLADAVTSSGGLFRFSLRHNRDVLFCSKGAAFRIPGQVGKYLILRRRRRQVLRYDAEQRSLFVPASCRPPFLVERALILCSGSPPVYEVGALGGTLRYSEIPSGIASVAAALLRQELR